MVMLPQLHLNLKYAAVTNVSVATLVACCDTTLNTLNDLSDHGCLSDTFSQIADSHNLNLNLGVLCMSLCYFYLRPTRSLNKISISSMMIK